MTLGNNKIGFDWTFKVTDIVRILVLLAAIVAGYERLDSRVSNVERQANDNSKALQEHIADENRIVSEGLKVLDRLSTTIEQFPPHRHTKRGEIIYPNHDGKSDDGAPH